jgi:hypothetical protein
MAWCIASMSRARGKMSDLIERAEAALAREPDIDIQDMEPISPELRILLPKLLAALKEAHEDLSRSRRNLRELCRENAEQKKALKEARAQIVELTPCEVCGHANCRCM